MQLFKLTFWLHIRPYFSKKPIFFLFFFKVSDVGARRKIEVSTLKFKENISYNVKKGF